MTMKLTLFAPSGVLAHPSAMTRAARRLRSMGYEVTTDPSVRARHQRFAGDDDDRLETLHRVARSAPSVALAARGGYGLTRLLDRIDWPLLAQSVDRGTRWVGYSDLTALQLGLLCHTGRVSWHGPMAAEDFGRLAGPDDAPDRQDQNEVTVECFDEAMQGVLEAVGFQTDAGFDGLSAEGLLWGGNLTMLCSLLGTPHFPQARIQGGILFLEDVGEHPYRVERMLLQLLQAGILGRQSAVLLGFFSDWKPSPLDRGYRFRSVVDHLRRICPVPILCGWPFGHVPLKVTVPIGLPVRLSVTRRQALVDWSDEQPD